jgi:hypothetical protein
MYVLNVHLSDSQQNTALCVLLSNQASGLGHAARRTCFGRPEHEVRRFGKGISMARRYIYSTSCFGSYEPIKTCLQVCPVKRENMYLSEVCLQWLQRTAQAKSIYSSQLGFGSFEGSFRAPDMIYVYRPFWSCGMRKGRVCATSRH